jgi:fructose-bisphosphate aldolase, class II
MTPIETLKNANKETLREVLTRLQNEGAALGHFNVADQTLVKSVVAAAAETKLPVFIGASEGEREFFGARQLAALVKSLRQESSDVPLFLNADHTHSLAKAIEAANAGFDCVGIDFSALPFDQNIARTKEAVQAIKSVNPAILAEGEIGNIGTGSEIHETAQGDNKLSTPEEARRFVEATGIDILAPAVGNMHGMLKSMVQGKAKKHLDIERIAQIKQAAGVFLTLHGGSGTDDDHFRKAIAAGTNIVHINTELRVAWRQSLTESLARDPDEVVPYKILRPVVDAVKHVVSSRQRLFHGEAGSGAVGSVA